MSERAIDTAAIPGWGIDTDPDNDPAWPMRGGDERPVQAIDAGRPARQAHTVEILGSIEHVRPPAVTGTATPPRGLSGAIRRLAFRRSESDWWHWLLLMGADRIDVVEGVAEDLAGGRVPNIPAEMGVRAEWRHNRAGLARKLGVVAAMSVAGYLLVKGTRRDDGPDDADDRPAAKPPQIAGVIHPAMRPS